MHRLWHQLLRKFRLLSRWEQVASVAMALLGLGAIGWVTWTELATSTPPSISMTTLVEDARKGQIQSASISQEAIELVYRDGWEASFRGQLPDETLVSWCRRASMSPSAALLSPTSSQEWASAPDAATDAADRLADAGRRQPLSRSAADRSWSRPPPNTASDVAGQEKPRTR